MPTVGPSTTAVAQHRSSRVGGSSCRLPVSREILALHRGQEPCLSAMKSSPSPEASRLGLHDSAGCARNADHLCLPFTSHSNTHCSKWFRSTSAQAQARGRPGTPGEGRVATSPLAASASPWHLYQYHQEARALRARHRGRLANSSSGSVPEGAFIECRIIQASSNSRRQRHGRVVATMCVHVALQLSPADALQEARGLHLLPEWLEPVALVPQ